MSSYMTPILRCPQWLKINERIELSLVDKVFTTSQPTGYTCGAVCGWRLCYTLTFIYITAYLCLLTDILYLCVY